MNQTNRTSGKDDPSVPSVKSSQTSAHAFDDKTTPTFHRGVKVELERDSQETYCKPGFKGRRSAFTIFRGVEKSFTFSNQNEKRKRTTVTVFFRFLRFPCASFRPPQKCPHEKLQALPPARIARRKFCAMVDLRAPPRRFARFRVLSASSSALLTRLRRGFVRVQPRVPSCDASNGDDTRPDILRRSRVRSAPLSPADRLHTIRSCDDKTRGVKVDRALFAAPLRPSGFNLSWDRS